MSNKNNKKPKIIIFVEGEDDSKVWYEVIKQHGLQEQIFVISGGGTNLVQNFIDVEKAFKNEDMYYFGLFDHDNQGLEYQRILNGFNGMKKCHTLKNLNIPEWAISKEGTIEIENLLYNLQLKGWVDIGRFLDDYKKNPRNYSLINNAWEKLLQLVNIRTENEINQNKIWSNCLVDLNFQNETIDFAGVLLAKKDYKKTWNVVHIYPKNGFNINSNKKGSDCYENLQVCSNIVSDQKLNNIDKTIVVEYENFKVFTHFKIVKNIFINNSNIGIVYVESQWNNVDDLKEEGFYFYNGFVFKKDQNDNLVAYIVDFEESKKNRQIVLIDNYSFTCLKQGKNKWIFTEEYKRSIFSNYIFASGGFRSVKTTNNNKNTNLANKKHK